MKKKMGKHKQVYLANGVVEGNIWRLVIGISTKQRKWGGSFTLVESKRNSLGKKNICLTSGSEQGWRWKLGFNALAKKRKWVTYFYLENEVQKYRDRIRSKDRNWAQRFFPWRWLQQFELHHDWNGGEMCYFLTPKEHREQDRILREAGIRSIGGKNNVDRR